MNMRPVTGAAKMALCVPALAMALGGAACSLSQPFPERAAFAFEPGRPEKLPASTAPASAATAQAPSTPAIRIMPMRAAKPFDSQLFLYKIGPEQFTQDYYNGFIAPPDRLLTAQLTEWLNDSGALRYAVPAGSTLECSANLESQLIALYADHTKNIAVIELRVLLVADASGPTAVLLQKVYRESQPLPANTPEALAAAWSAAWREVLTRLVRDLQGLPAGTPPRPPGG